MIVGMAVPALAAGTALGVAVLGALVTATIVGPVATGFVDAARVSWVVMCGCGLLVVVLALVTTGRWARGTAERLAVLFDVDVPAPVATAR
ncbi:hypothetical protein [Pseudonocardia sediminis]|nr:hypothetical protein [Pseudonocardia sediminis]